LDSANDYVMTTVIFSTTVNVGMIAKRRRKWSFEK
jgi:hypothetical protein